MPNLILDTDYSRLCVLGKETESPDRSWLAMQDIQPQPTTGKWFSAYPLSGGAINVHESKFIEDREIIQTDIDRICNRNPATETVKKILGIS
ncbi:MAG: hypothetical protein KAS32_14940 [Candidatus Peribacteraceae bacterium]|nr:hypothetical protein [Candidatus Peribacteraceae bacterium]